MSCQARAALFFFFSRIYCSDSWQVLYSVVFGIQSFEQVNSVQIKPRHYIDEQFGLWSRVCVWAYDSIQVFQFVFITIEQV